MASQSPDNKHSLEANVVANNAVKNSSELARITKARMANVDGGEEAGEGVGSKCSTFSSKMKA